jgi:hypothetical protein
VEFEWDPGKASRNHRKHGITFHEAATTFGDPLAITYSDPDHSSAEKRFITIGQSKANRCLIIAHTDRNEKSAHAELHYESEDNMKKKPEKRESTNGLRREYDLSKLKDGVRGEYLARYRAGTNLVLLSPDVAKHFPDERAVNAALRRLIKLPARSLRRTN